MNLSISITRNDHLGEFDKIFRDVVPPYLTTAASQVLSVAQQLSPHDTGAFKGGLKVGEVEFSQPGIASISVYPQGNPIKAQVIEGVDSAGNPTEYGRKPGKGLPVVMVPGIRKPQVKTNILVTSGWIARKLGLTGVEARRAAYFIARKIKREGIPPRSTARSCA